MASRAELAAARRLQKLADKAEPLLRARVLRALKALQAGVRMDRLERVLASGDAFSVYELAATLPYRLQQALRTLNGVYVATAAQAAADLRPYGIRLRFNMADPYAVRAAREQAAALVTRVTEQTRKGIRVLITRSFTEGIPPREAARMIRPLIGLTDVQARAVYAMRARLLANGLTRQRAAEQVARYAERLLTQRAITIARTETIRAAAQGQLAAWREARMRGLLPQGVRKQWMVTPDDRLCPQCSELDGAVAPLDGTFADTGVDAPPLHPRCRCAVVVDMVSVRQPQPVRRRGMRVGGRAVA